MTHKKKCREVEVNNTLPRDVRDAMIVENLPYLMHFAFSRYGRSWIQATFDEDFEGELSLYLLRTFSCFDPSKGSFRNWAIWRVRSLFAKKLSLYRTRKGFLDSVCRYEPGALQNVAVQKNRLSQEVRDELERYRSVLNRLDERRRTAVLLYEQGFTLQEVGESLGVGRERARQLVEDSIVRIRKELGLLVDDDRSKSNARRFANIEKYRKQRREKAKSLPGRRGRRKAAVA